MKSADKKQSDTRTSKEIETSLRVKRSLKISLEALEEARQDFLKEQGEKAKKK